MSEFHLPWLTLCILTPLAGAAVIARLGDSSLARRWSTALTAVTFALSLAAVADFLHSGASELYDPGNLIVLSGPEDVLLLDNVSAPLLVAAALLYMLTSVATLRTKIRHFSFASMLASEGLLLAMFCCRAPWAIICLLALGAIPPYLELRARRQPTRVYLLHAGASVLLLLMGGVLLGAAERGQVSTETAILPLLLAILIRGGIAPFHCWVRDLFDRATFGTALLTVAPLPAAYAAARLLLPLMTDGVMNAMGLLALFSAIYASGIALVQNEARRFFCYLLLSHAALVFVGLDSISVIGLTGALCVWLSVTLALGGLGLTLRALEARHGRMSLSGYLGLFDDSPALAVCFLLTGLASVGFPGTLGFIGGEMLVDGAVQAYPYVGVAVVAAAALNGIAVVKVYFQLFTGARHHSDVPLNARLRERVAVLILAALILGGGLWPQPLVQWRYQAAEQILNQRPASLSPQAAKGERPKATHSQAMRPSTTE